MIPHLSRCLEQYGETGQLSVKFVEDFARLLDDEYQS